MTSATTSATWKEYWGALQVGECVEQGNMQLFGLRHGMRPAIDYLTLERALKVGKGEEFRVDEVSVGGSVTDLKVHNGLDSPEPHGLYDDPGRQEERHHHPGGLRRAGALEPQAGGEIRAVGSVRPLEPALRQAGFPR